MPLLSWERLEDAVTRKSPPAAIVLEGRDAYLRELCRKQIAAACVPEGARDWAVLRLGAREEGWQEILQRARMMPMLAPRQVLIIQDAESIEKLGEKARERAIEDLAEYLGKPAPFSVLVLEAAALDKRQRFYKLLNDKATIVPLSIAPESAPALASRMAAESDVQMEPAAARLLAEIVNAEPARMRMEIEKLAAFAGEAKRITAANVQSLVVAARRNTVWEMADLLAAGERAAALRFLDNLLREGEQPPMIVGALAFRFRQILEGKGYPSPPLAAARQPGGSKRRVLRSLQILADADNRLKSSNPNPRALLEFAVAEISK